MTIISILTLFGGVGMFLYGMSLLGDSLEQIAGAKLEKILEKLTNTRLSGVALGTVTTGVIQSSAATTVMLIGFVNAGIMKLSQAVPVVMGANIGSTVTGQILRLGDITSDNIFLTILQPCAFAPLIIAIGAGILLLGKKKRTKNIAKILLGFGILFMGMTVMEQTVSPLKENEAFREMFTKFTNPFLGILVGLVITAIIQSSSASVGILQAISSTGAVTFSMAFPIILGQNLGKCFTVLLGSIGTNKKARRVSIIYLLFNVIGVIVFMVLIYSIQLIFGIPFWDTVMNRGNIADIHSLFNIGTTIILLPLTTMLVKLSGILIRDNDKENANHHLDILNDVFLKTPVVALEQSKKVVANMENVIQENYQTVISMFAKFSDKKMNLIDENERFLDKAETALGEYLVKITSCSLGESSVILSDQLMHNISDLERMGDYCIKISNVLEYNDSNKISFSDDAQKELNCMAQAVKASIDLAFEANCEQNLEMAYKVEPLEEVIDSLKDKFIDSHLERLKNGKCNVSSGISFVEIVTNLERISDHCSNIAIQVIKRKSGLASFDIHEHKRTVHKSLTEEYKTLYDQYEEKYHSLLEV